MTAGKQLWILAGGNGAGKSTFYSQFLSPLGLPFVNADLIARDIDPQDPQGASYAAAKVAAQLREDLLQAGVSFCFETVFSHPSKVDFVAEAKALSYEIVLVFIHLQMAELNQARVTQRVSEGGHAVPADKIASRIPRTLRHIRTTLPLVDTAQLYDNSSWQSPFRPVARLGQGRLLRQMEPMPAWAEEMLEAYL